MSTIGQPEDKYAYRLSQEADKYYANYQITSADFKDLAAAKGL